jgi:hypothetical protein
VIHLSWQPSSLPTGKAVRRHRLRIHWAWVPAAIFSIFVGWSRYGWMTTVLAVLAGLSLAAYAEWRARRRRRAIDP